VNWWAGGGPRGSLIGGRRVVLLAGRRCSPEAVLHLRH